MPLDLARYRPYFDDADLSDAQKDEFITQLWVMMKSFVERAAGIDPAQICIGLRNDKDSISSVIPIESTHCLTDNFNIAAHHGMAGERNP